MVGEGPVAGHRFAGGILAFFRQAARRAPTMEDQGWYITSPPLMLMVAPVTITPRPSNPAPRC